MPVTPAHAVVALPFRRSHRWSAAAVAAGAVAPDLPLLLTGGAGYDLTHSLWAVPTLDVLLGAVCLLAWWALIRPGLLAVLPAPARSRIAARRAFPVPMLVIALALGALTHVVWDAFTHAGRLGSVLLPVLAERVGPLPLTSWLQYASGVGGCVVIGVALLGSYRRTRPEPMRRGTPLGRAAAPVRMGVVSVVLAAAAIAAWRTSFVSASGTAYATITSGLLAAVVALIAVGTAVRLIAARSDR